MMNTRLQTFYETLIEHTTITEQDIQILRTVILPEGITTQVEADALIALDRVLEPTEEWSRLVTDLVVKYVLWGNRRKGRINAETAHWLIASLEVGVLTDNATRIVREVVSGAEVVDPVLVDFVLHRVRRSTRNRYAERTAA